MSRRIARVLSVLIAIFLCGCGAKVEYDDVEIGYRGLARTKPFLAAQRLLDELGFDVRTSRDLRQCIKGRGTVITPLQSFNSRGEADEIARWTRRGGHLILMLAGGESWRDDWAKLDFKTIWEILKRREEPGQKHLLTLLGVGEVSAHSGGGTTGVKIGRRTFDCELVGRMKVDSLPGWGTTRAGDKDEPSMVSFSFGSGRVSILAHAQPFRNRYIGNHDHAGMLSALLSLGVADEVWFLDGVRVSFWRMLWEQAWLGISVLGILLVVWLARYLRRFGPVAAYKSESAREFSDHLLLTGAFLWRHKKGDALLEPVQNAILAAARRRGWHELNDEFYRFITERTGMNSDRARAIVSSRAPSDAHGLRLLVQDLKKMLDALGG